METQHMHLMIWGSLARIDAPISRDGGDRGAELVQFLVGRGAALAMATPEHRVGIEVGTTSSLCLRALCEGSALTQ
jgi:hypothetical protein